MKLRIFPPLSSLLQPSATCLPLVTRRISSALNLPYNTFLLVSRGGDHLLGDPTFFLRRLQATSANCTCCYVVDRSQVSLPLSRSSLHLTQSSLGRHQIYSLDRATAPAEILIAGGKRGMISLFSCQNRPGTDEEDSSPPLSLSVQLHRRWISSLHSVMEGRLEGRCSLLTAADDGALALSTVTSTLASTRLTPVQRLSTAHAAGIFAMDVRRTRVVTASKVGD